MSYLTVKEDAKKLRRGSFEGEYNVGDVTRRIVQNEKKLMNKFIKNISDKLEQSDRPITGIIIIPLNGQVVSNSFIDEFKRQLYDTVYRCAIIIDEIIVLEAFIKVIYHEKVI